MYFGQQQVELSATSATPAATAKCNKNDENNNQQPTINSLCNNWPLLRHVALSCVDKIKSSSCKCSTNMSPLTLIDNNCNNNNNNNDTIKARVGAEKEDTVFQLAVQSMARHHQSRESSEIAKRDQSESSSASLTHFPNERTLTMSCQLTADPRSDCRKQHSQHCSDRTSGKSGSTRITTRLLLTHNTLLCVLLMIICSCILINLCDASSSTSASGSGKTRKHSASKTHFLKTHHHQKTSSLSSSPSITSSSASSGHNSSPIKFISIKRATATTQQKQQSKDTKSLISNNNNNSPTELAADYSNHNNQLTSNDSPPSATINSVSKQLAATLISAAASTLAQTATESVLKAVQTGSGLHHSSSSSTASSAHHQGIIKRPSKIYNLPVKFVSNGQPNNFVMGLKQHLASIKKSASNNKKSVKKTTNNKMGKTPVFKPNSKFIYLPLKYLSNAKPYMVKKGEY